MNVGNKLALTISRIPPLAFLLFYITLIPFFACFYTFLTPLGFYAPYARYESAAVADTNELAHMLADAIHRTIDHELTREIVAGNWKLDYRSLRIADVESSDGSHLSFKIFISAIGIGEFAGARQMGWSIVVTVPAKPNFAALSRSDDEDRTYRIPELSTLKYNSPFKAEDEALFKAIFGDGPLGFGQLGPALALNWQQELQLQRYLRGMKGDPASFTGQLSRMVYLSSVIITTLGLGDIIPITPTARMLVATEAVLGIVTAGLFLNALAFRASNSGK